MIPQQDASKLISWRTLPSSWSKNDQRMPVSLGLPDARGTSSPSNGELLKMKYPKVPLGAPEYCKPRGAASFGQRNGTENGWEVTLHNFKKGKLTWHMYLRYIYVHTDIHCLALHSITPHHSTGHDMRYTKLRYVPVRYSN